MTSRRRPILAFAIDNLLAILSLLICAGSLVGYLVYVSANDPTVVESSLFQLVILITGLVGTFLLGRHSAIGAARELIQPHAKSAFRRVLSLYRSLYALSERIEDLKREGEDWRLDLIQALVNEQIRTGQDAMEDWKDIVPEEVKQIEAERSGDERSG